MDLLFDLLFAEVRAAVGGMSGGGIRNNRRALRRGPCNELDKAARRFIGAMQATVTETGVHSVDNDVELQLGSTRVELAHPEHVEELAGAVALNVALVLALEAVLVGVKRLQDVWRALLAELGPEVVLRGHNGEASGLADALGGAVQRLEHVGGNEGGT